MTIAEQQLIQQAQQQQDAANKKELERLIAECKIDSNPSYAKRMEWLRYGNEVDSAMERYCDC